MDNDSYMYVFAMTFGQFGVSREFDSMPLSKRPQYIEDSATDAVLRAHQVAELEGHGCGVRVEEGIEISTQAVKPGVQNDSKYGSIVGIPDGEPCFVLRAKDRAAILTILDYIKECDMLGVVQSHIDSCYQQVERFRAWREANPDLMKIPD